MHLPQFPDKFTLGDFLRMFIGWVIYLQTSISITAKTDDSIDYLNEGVRGSISICVAIIILIISYIIRGILEDKESWLHIKIHKIIDICKFKKKLDKDSVDESIEDIIL